MEIRPANDAVAGEDMMRRIIQNQRTIIEQNSKIIQSQERLEAFNKEQGKTTNVQVPNFVKVSKDNLFKTRRYERVHLK